MSVASSGSVDELRSELLNLESQLLVVIESVKKLNKRLKQLEAFAGQAGFEPDSESTLTGNFDDNHDSCAIC